MEDMLGVKRFSVIGQTAEGYLFVDYRPAVSLARKRI